jgi:cellulose synthase/poly-beta-1,6-N-acetylglucosamine synthase-like glycosyltransferase
MDRYLPDTRIDTYRRSLLDLAQNQNLQILNGIALHNLGLIVTITNVLSIIGYTIISITMVVTIIIHTFYYLSKHIAISITTKIGLKVLKIHYTQ